MPAFQVLLTLDDNGAWSSEPRVPNGTTVSHADVTRLLAVALEVYTRNPGQRLLTVAEVAAIEEERRLPPGWVVTPDGVNTYVESGTPRWTRWFVRGEDRVEAPCGADGYPTRDTRIFLVNYEHPTPEA